MLLVTILLNILIIGLGIYLGLTLNRAFKPGREKMTVNTKRNRKGQYVAKSKGKIEDILHSVALGTQLALIVGLYLAIVNIAGLSTFFGFIRTGGVKEAISSAVIYLPYYAVGFSAAIFGLKRFGRKQA